MKSSLRVASAALVAAGAIVGATRPIPAQACPAYCPTPAVTLLPPDYGTYRDGGFLHALVTSGSTASVAKVRLRDSGVESFTLGTAGGESLVVDRGQTFWIADAAHNQVTQWSMAGDLVGSFPLPGPRDLAIFPIFTDADQSSAIATSSGMAMIEPSTLTLRSVTFDAMPSRAVTAVGLTSFLLAAGTDTSGKIMSVSVSGTALQATSSVALTGISGCGPEADDLAAVTELSGELAVWDARCEALYSIAFGSGALTQSTALTQTIGTPRIPDPWSHNQFAARQRGNFLVDSSALLLPEVVSGFGSPTVQTPDFDGASAWIATTGSGAGPAVFRYDRISGAVTDALATLGPAGAVVRDLFFIDRPPVLTTPGSVYYYEACGSGNSNATPPPPTTVTFQVSATDPDGDPVEVSFPDLYDYTFDAATGTVSIPSSSLSSVGCIRVDAISGRLVNESYVAMNRNYCPLMFSCSGFAPSCECRCSQDGRRSSMRGGMLQIAGAFGAFFALRSRAKSRA